MPGSDYGGLAERLPTEGLDPRTPCLVVSQATTSRQQVQFATLANLAEIPPYEAPVVLIVGAVAERYASERGKPTREAEALPFAIDFEPAELAAQNQIA